MPNNQMTPQECKKVLEEILRILGNQRKSKDKQQVALTYALNLIQEYEELKKAIESAGEELPERKECYIHGKEKWPGCGVCQHHTSRNQIYDLCQPILAKYKLRVEKLGDELEQERVRLAGCLCVAEGHIDKNVKQGVYGWSLPYERIKDLQSQLSALRGKVDVGKKCIKCGKAMQPDQKSWEQVCTKCKKKPRQIRGGRERKGGHHNWPSKGSRFEHGTP